MATNQSRYLGRAVAVAVSLASTTAFQAAAAAEGSEATTLEEIVVTARKREESAQKVPEAVTAVSAAQIEQSFQSSAAGISGMAPSLVFDRVISGPATASISIRGIGFSDVEKSFDPAVGVAVDGVFLGTSTGQTFQIFDLQRMEILRGPQGTLFGKNTIGGAISIIRTEPTGEFGGKVRVGSASRSGWNVDGLLNLPSIGDQLATKLFYTKREQDGFDRNIAKNGKREGGTDYSSYGASLKWTPIETLKVIYTYQKEIDDSPIPGLANTSLRNAPLADGTLLTDLFCASTGFCSLDGLGVIPQTGDRRVVNQNGSNAQTFDLKAHTLSANWEVADGYTVNYLFGERKSDEQTNEDFDASPASLYQTVRTQSYKQDSHELRLTYDQDGRFNLVTGVYLWDAEYQLHQDTEFFGLPRAITQDTKHSTESWAAFAQSDIRITEEWIATLGGRYTSEEKQLETNSGGPFAGSPFSTFGTPAKDEWTKFTPKVGIRWQFTPLQMSYLSYSTGFRSGGFNGRAATPQGATIPYNPETVTSIELGYKSRWLDDRLQFNADIYTSKYKDKQEDIVVPVTATTQETLTQNAAEAKFNGVEMEMLVIPVSGLTIQANAAYLDAKYDEFCAVTGNRFDVAPTCGLNGARDYSDSTLRRAPKITAALSGTYVWQMGPGEFTANAAARYKSKYYTTFQNIPLGLARAATIMDASLSYAVGDWKLSAYGHNLADKTVQNSALKVAGLWSFSTYNLPREYGVDLQYKFGSK